MDDFLVAAQYAGDCGGPSPFLRTSNMDMAHYVGMWARTNRMTVHELKRGRGYKWVLNRMYELDFKTSSDCPTVKKV